MKGYYLYLLLAVAMAALCWLLWTRGYMVLSLKRAALFFGHMYGKDRVKVRFSRCSGTVRKVLRLGESGLYSFRFNCETGRGEAGVEILDRNKAAVLQLSQAKPSGTLYAESGGRYYLVLRFHDADGALELTWERI